jgi:UV excision repair protein RAD23
MGFPKDQCEKALRAAFNDSERAADYLLNGNIPEHPPSQELPPGDMAAHVLGGIVNNPQFAQIRQLIRNDPSALGPILQQIAQTSPQLYQVSFEIKILVNFSESGDF